jgi:putative ABC transport system permease protein
MANRRFSLWLHVFRDITRRKSRSLLTILGIAVGVASLVAIVSTSRNLAAAQAEAYADISRADLTYWVREAPTSLQRILETVPNVAAADLRTTYYTRARFDGLWYDIYFIGIPDFSTMEVSTFDLYAGDYPGPGEVLLEVSAQELAPLEIGQQIIYRSGPDHAEHPLTISGFSQSPAQPSSVFLNLVYAYVPAVQVQKMVDTTGHNQVLIKLEDFSARNETIEALDDLFNKRRIQHSAPNVRDPDYFEGKRELDALVRIMYAFSALGLLISAFLVANTLAAIVAEQVREIGIMKSIGGSRQHITRIYLLEAALYGLVGTLVGLVLGTVVSWLLLDYAGWALNLQIPPRPSPVGLILGLAVGLVVSVLGGLGPARRAANITVHEAIGSHGITSAYEENWLDQLLERLRHVPPLVMMALRNLRRRAGRQLLTLLFSAAATAALLAAQSTQTSVNQAIAGIFDTYRADAYVWLNEVVSNQFATQVVGMQEVADAEPWTLTDAWIRFAEVRLWGLPADTRLYDAEVVAGRWFRRGEWGAVVVSTDLAESKDIRVGDIVEVDTGQASRDFRVVGLAVDNAIFLGGPLAGKVFAPRETVERMIDRQDRGYFFAVDLAAEGMEATDIALNDLERRFRTLRPVTESAQRDMASARQQSRLLTIALYVMTVLIALAGGLGVMNTLTLNVLERRREIGVMRAIGASNRNLIQIFVTEGLTIGVLSWLVGLALAYPVGRLLLRLLETVLFDIPFIFGPELVLIGGAFAVLLSTTASLVPALGAARLPAQEALHYE